MAQTAAAAPRDPEPSPDADLLEFLGSWQTGDDRWVDPFHVGEVSALETGAQESVSRRSEAGGQTQQQPGEKTHELKRKGTDVTAPRKDVKP